MDITSLPDYRNNPEELADKLSADDIALLVTLLCEKNDDIRYPAFLTLQERSRKYPDVYPFWPEFTAKMDDDNSFQRNIGLILMAANVKWDTENRFAEVFPAYMRHCTDEKFITCRMTIQGISHWAAYRPQLLKKTTSILFNIDIHQFKASQIKLILIDIVNALLAIRKIHPSDEIDAYICNALTGGILDKKNIREIETRM